MGALSLQIPTKINPTQVFSIKDLKDNWLQGIPLSKEGKEIADSTLDLYVQSAFNLVEDYLGLKLTLQVISETKDFVRDDWVKWSYIKTTYPVRCPISVMGFYNKVKQVEYPKDWFVTKQSSDGKSFHRTIELVPAYNSATANALFIQQGMMNHAATLGRLNYIPGYWQIKYVTGFQKLPADIKQAVGLVASMLLLPIVSDMIIGANAGNGGLGWGVSSKSISLDGLSQSSSTFAGQTGVFGARMKQYSETLWGVGNKSGLLDILKDSYSSIIWGVA